MKRNKEKKLVALIKMALVVIKIKNICGHLSSGLGRIASK